MRTTKKAAVVGTTVAALMGSGIAFAAWTSTGSGDGSASAATDKGLSVSAAPVTGLFPTGTQNQAVTVTNNNDYPVTLDALTSSVTTHDAGTCKITSVLNDGPATARIAAGAGVLYHFTVGMGADSDDSCKLGTFTIGYSSTAHSSN